MGRRILIVGTGQSGLYLAHRLAAAGHDVRLVGASTAEEIQAASPAITQMSMPSSFALEQQAGLLGFRWQEMAPRLHGVDLSLRPPGTDPILISADWSRGPGLSVDRSVKIADWLAYYDSLEDTARDRRGSVTTAMTTEALDFLAERHAYDLIVVATGNGELGHLFDRDPGRSAGAERRAYAQAFVYGAHEQGDRIRAVSCDQGEVFTIPVLTLEGVATSVMMSARPGSDFDLIAELGTNEDPRRVSARDPERVWENMRAAMAKHVPDVADQCQGAELVPLTGSPTLLTHVDPVVRSPVGVLPSGGLVIGLADVVLGSDPVSCQGWANSTYHAELLYQAVGERGDRPFTREWMEDVHARFWDLYGQHSTAFSGMIRRFWAGSLEPHYLQVAAAAHHHPQVAQRWVDAFDRPADFTHWLHDPLKAHAFLRQVGAL
ncbi:styrene monooxygenase/indole monooxygenase family protein [Nocardiopsis sp. NPDC049922]|uniref:styrene monooxygenase/indole monooxygenase family protein n=1 Tax=Nocardiopsis sp. NPDC049922 TaxID=3155157 RepID=UPI0033E48283